MKKTLFSSLICILLCAVMIFGSMPISPAKAAEDASPLVGTSLYFDDQVDLRLFFDSSKIDSSFTLTTTFDGVTYDADDLVKKVDKASGKTYKVLTVGPFAADQYDTAFTYTVNGTEVKTFSLTDIARTSVSFYEGQDGYENDKAAQDLVNLLKAFANYGVAVDNLASGTSTYLPYETTFTSSDFTPATSGTPLSPSRQLTGRKFVMAEDVYMVYYGNVASAGETSSWTVTFNGKDVTSVCELTENGSEFSFRLPLEAEQGTEKLRIIIRNGSGTVLYDCIDKADVVAQALGNIAGYEELSAALGSYLQAASAYALSPEIMPLTYEENKFYAGFGRVDITPYTEKVMLNSQYATEFVDSIYITCVALRDAEGTVSLIFSLDIRNIPSLRNQVYQTISAQISEKTGVDPDHIFFNATHNHSAPSVTSSDATVTQWFNEYFYPRLPVAAKLALEDLTAVDKVYAGNKDTASGTNYNRRYKPGGYEDGADKNLRTIRFDREAGKDILMVNWQCHAAHGSGTTPTQGSADIIERFRLVVEKEVSQGGMGMHLIYINGASGDLNMTARGESTHPDYRAKADSVAGTIKSLVGSSAEKEVSLGEIKVNKTPLYADLHYRAHDDGTYCYDPECGICKKAYTIAKSQGASAFASENQYNSYIDQKNGANLAYHPTTINLWTMTIGDDIGFAFVPYEMFNQNGVDLRAAVNSQTGGGKTIFTAGYTNGYLAYMPSEVAWAKVDSTGADDGANEVYTARYVRGTAERCIEQLTTDLVALFNN